MRMRRLLLILVTLLVPLFALSVPTGLNIMPTAESVGMAKSQVTYESQGSGKLYVPESSTLYGTQFGAIFGVEGGIDQVSGKGTVLNGKWVFRSEGLLFPALAVGVQNVHAGDKSQYYIAATKSLLPSGTLKAHAGLLRLDGDTLTMIGASAIFSSLILKADHVNGGPLSGSAVSVGIKSSSYTITGTRYFMENRHDETTFSINYSYAGF